MEWDFPCKVVIKLDDNPNNDRSRASLVFIDNHRRVEINAQLGREKFRRDKEGWGTPDYVRVPEWHLLCSTLAFLGITHKYPPGWWFQPI